MAFSVNDIRSQLEFGGARGTLFRVMIQNPVNNEAFVKTTFLTRSASIPDASLGTIPVPYFGRMIKLAGDRNFQPWEVVVINDEDFKIRKAMEEWSSRINTLQGNIRNFNNSTAAQYKANATVEQFSKTGDIIRVYEFHGLWPSSVSPIQLDWGAQDNIEEFSVTFEYDWWNIAGGQTDNGKVI